jgi:hypothetical protein
VLPFLEDLDPGAQFLERLESEVVAAGYLQLLSPLEQVVFRRTWVEVLAKDPVRRRNLFFFSILVCFLFDFFCGLLARAVRNRRDIELELRWIARNTQHYNKIKIN